MKFSRVSRRCDGIADEFGAIWWASMGPGRGAVIGVRIQSVGRGAGRRPSVAGTAWSETCRTSCGRREAGEETEIRGWRVNHG